MSEAIALDSDRYLKGLQCELRLWLDLHSPELGARSASIAERESRARGRREVRELASGLFPEARCVAVLDEGRAIARTRELLADPSAKVVRDGLFSIAGARARIDFVERLRAGGFGLRSVRAAHKPSEAELVELAFDYHVARESGLEIGSVEVILLDAAFTRGSDAPDPRALLRRVDVTGAVESLSDDLEANLRKQLAVLARIHAPEIGASPHCRRPDSCEFLARCTAGKREDWIGYLPGLRTSEFEFLREQEVGSISQVSEEFTRTPAQRNARESLLRGGVFAAGDLSRRLAGFGPPADCLDFEAILPEIPIFAGTHPLEFVPFQWSALLSGADGGHARAEFLADGSCDPRRAFAESLLTEFAPRKLPILVYSDFESEEIGKLARSFADLSQDLLRVRSRLRDLLPLLRRSVYHPAFLGSFSLKRVAPTLCPGFTFSDLPGVADGGAAARGWLALARGEISRERGAELLAELREYCARDSLALLRLLQALRRFEVEDRTQSDR